MATTGFKIQLGPRMRGVSSGTPVDQWLQFLTREGLYDKTIRTKEAAVASGKSHVIFPVPSEGTEFYAYKRDGDMFVHLKYEEGGYLNELREGDALMVEGNTQVILLPELKTALGLSQGGGKRRHSRKAKVRGHH